MENTSGSAQQSEQVSSATVSHAAESATTQQQEKLVKWDDHKRAIDDMHKYKAQARQLEAERETLKRQFEEAGLKQKEDFKTLYEKEKEMRLDAESKFRSTLESVVYNEKFKAASQALIKSGLKPEAIKIVARDELKDIVVETTSEGRFLVNGVETFVDYFKREHPYAFQQVQASNINGNGGVVSVESSQVTPAMILEAESLYKKDPNNREKKEKYLTLIAKYKSQKK